MKHWAFLGLLAGLYVLTGCGIYKQVQSSRESTKEAVKVIEHTEYVPVYIETKIPEISERVAVKDTTSHLENKYAESDAQIKRDGTLSHSLKTKPQTITTETKVKVEYRDSIVFKEKVIEKPIYIEAQIKWYNKLFIWLGRLSCVVAIIWVLCLYLKRKL